MENQTVSSNHRSQSRLIVEIARTCIQSKAAPKIFYGARVAPA